MKIPKILLILVIVTALFISCENQLLPQDDVDIIAEIGMLSTFFPALIILDGPGALDVDDLVGISFNQNNNKFTWNNFDLAKAAKVLEDFANDGNEFIDTIVAIGVGQDEGQVVIISGTAILTEDDDDKTFFDANVRLKLNITDPDVEIPKGTFNIQISIVIEDDNDDFEINVKVNNQKAF